MILTALILGFGGSLHCAGMCGSILISMPRKSTSSNEYVGFILYHLSRAIGYGLLGILGGILGALLNLFIIQQYLSLTVGLGILLLFFVNLNKPKIGLPFSLLERGFSKLFLKDGLHIKCATGFLNAFLPCGLIYVALGASVALAHWYESFLFMFLFGMGTLPVMLFISFSAKHVSVTLRNKLKLATPTLTVIFALLMITRGLGLGIPYISPKLNKNKQVTTVDGCCSSAEERETITFPK